jgi:hypothetical protein
MAMYDHGDSLHNEEGDIDSIRFGAGLLWLLIATELAILLVASLWSN